MYFATRHSPPATMALLLVSTSLYGCHNDALPVRTAPVARMTQTPPAATPAPPRALASTAEVSEAALPSVVNISSTKIVHRSSNAPGSLFDSDPFFRHFFDGLRTPGQRSPHSDRGREKSLGSGVIVGQGKHVLTNNHVVKDAQTIRVTLADQREVDAKVIGRDPASDLAVLRLEAAPDDLKPLAFGDSSRLRLGEIVLAIGNPFGVGQTVTMGIVSAKGRANVGIVDYEDFIQTDAAINPGNSGGALLNLRGELVGINTAILSKSGGYQGIGFAIPANMAKSIMESLIRDGKVTRGFLGVLIQDLTPDLAEALDLVGRRGALVSDITPNSPAQQAGLRAQDLVVSVDGSTIASAAALRNKVASTGAGQTVELGVIRNGQLRTFTAVLDRQGGASNQTAVLDIDEGPFSGLTLENLSDTHRHRYEITDRIRSGVVITRVESTRAGLPSSLREGDVILDANRRPVANVQQLEEAYRGSPGKLLLRVHRRGGSMYLLLRD